uniref:CSON000423 protein n=1 Tax=Culicoides sonorensis TaxID=179676 RepID=A0A336KW44_CULSO
MPVGGRVAGKVGYSSNYGNGQSYAGINEEIVWASIGMAILIFILLAMALCYVAREKCQKRREYYITA